MSTKKVLNAIGHLVFVAHRRLEKMGTDKDKRRSYALQDAVVTGNIRRASKICREIASEWIENGHGPPIPELTSDWEYLK